VRRVRTVCVGAAFQFSATFGDGRRRQGLAHRLRAEFVDDRPQRADAWRERVAVVLDDIVKLLGESGGFFVGIGQGS
jgi:hypothetical protein